MITASLFKNGQNQAVRLPKDLAFKGISKQGNSIVLTPIRNSWKSFADVKQADTDFLQKRDDILELDRVEF